MTLQMKTHNLELTTEQLIFVAFNLIRDQLLNHALIESYCETYCDTDEEVLEQKEWHIKMLRELREAQAIHRCYTAVDQAFEAIL